MANPSSFYGVAVTKMTLTTGVALEVKLPEGSKDHLFRVEESVTWRVATSSAAASAALPLTTPESLEIRGPIRLQSLYFYQASGASATLHWSYLHPMVR